MDIPFKRPKKSCLKQAASLSKILLELYKLCNPEVKVAFNLSIFITV